MLLAVVICIFAVLLQSGDTKKWVQFLEEENISYDKADLDFEPEIISAQTVDVAPKLNRLIQSMEEDIKQLRNDFQKKIDETILRVHKSTQEELKMPWKPELRHQYGMLFNHQGYVMPGLQSLQLFLAVDLQKIEDLYHEPPEFPNCSIWAALDPFYKNYYSTKGSYYIKWTVYKEINKSLSFLNEAVHHKVCIQYQSKYNNLLSQIRTIKNDIEYKIKHVMPRLLPNEKALVYGRETLVEHIRDKRAIPIGLIFLGVSAIGGLLIKGFNAISNYKKSTAMARAMKELYKAQEIDHKRLQRLEHHTSLLAKATKMAFTHKDGKLTQLDVKLGNVMSRLQEFMVETTDQFRHTWQITTSSRLAIMLLSNGAAMYDRVLHKYLQYYINYQVTLDHFLTGLECLGTGCLTFQVFDRIELTEFLDAITRKLHTEKSSFALVFDHTFQYYAEPMVSFSNTHDQLLVNIPVLLYLTNQKDLILYSIDTVLMPFDTEILDRKNDEFTFINNSYPYMAINKENYIPLDERQLHLCDKMGATYYCEN